MNTDEIFQHFRLFCPSSAFCYSYIAIIDQTVFNQIVGDDPLGISIAKWEFIVHAITLWGEDVFPLLDGGAVTCGLCRAYSSFCRDCPTECSSDSFPYKRYRRATSWEEALETAEDEVKHLKSLQETTS